MRWQHTQSNVLRHGGGTRVNAEDKCMRQLPSIARLPHQLDSWQRLAAAWQSSAQAGSPSQDEALVSVASAAEATTDLCLCLQGCRQGA